MTAPSDGRSANGAAPRRPSTAGRPARQAMPLSNPTRQIWTDLPTLRLAPGERERFEAEARSRVISHPYVPRSRGDEGRL